MAYIEINNVSRVYNDADRRVAAVSDVSLDIDRGDYVSIVGASGAGKSTLLHLIGGLDLASSGTIIVDGENITKMKRNSRFRFRNSKIGFVYQFYHLIHELTAIENVMLPSVVAKNSFSNSVNKAKELLGFFGLSERMNFYPHEMSGGEQQRVALARALINNPDILLCDEPTGNLDTDATKMIREYLSHLNRDKQMTIVLVTHNLELANDAKTVLNIKKGKLEE